MTKYKLKKELFDIKAGTVFDEVEDESDDYVIVNISSSDFSVKIRKNTVLFDIWFEKIDEEYKPERDEKYCYINNSAGVGISIWIGDSVDEVRYEIGNVFKSEEETKEAAEWIKARATLMRDTKGFEVVPGKTRYQVYFDDNDGLSAYH